MKKQQRNGISKIVLFLLSDVSLGGYDSENLGKNGVFTHWAVVLNFYIAISP
jgi:hypothetical protein